MVSGILLLTCYKNYDIFFIIMSPNQLSFTLYFKNDVRVLDILLAYQIVREHYRAAIQFGLTHFLRSFKRLGKKALKLNFQPKNDRTKI